jgi:hypothetical protein
LKVIPSTGSKLKRPTPTFHSSRTSLAGDTSNSSSPASTGAKTNRAGKCLSYETCIGLRGEGEKLRIREHASLLSMEPVMRIAFRVMHTQKGRPEGFQVYRSELQVCSSAFFFFLLFM